MKLLQQIKEAAIDPDTDITVALRKAKVLSVKLGHEPFKKWIDLELNGYPSKEGLPDYRVLHVQSYGHFAGPFGRGLKNALIPPRCLPKELRRFVTTADLTEAISAYGHLVKNGANNTPRLPWPADWVAQFASQIYEGMNCLEAWQLIPISAIVALLDTVRNRLLSFVLEIEKQAPEAGESGSGDRPLPQDQVNQIFNTHIYGGTNTIATASSNFTQSIHTEVQAGDTRSLNEYLVGLGLTETDVKELEVALKADPPPKTPGRFGGKVSAWIGKMTQKAFAGGWDVAAEGAGGVLAAVICKYYGIL